MEYVDLTHFFPWAWIIHLVRALISFNVIHAILKDRYNSFITLLSITASGMLYSGVTLYILTKVGTTPSIEVVVAFIYYVVQFAVVMAVCEGKPFPKAFSVVFGLVVYECVTLIFEFLRNIFIDNKNVMINQFNVGITDYIIMCATMFSLSFLFAALIRLLKPKNNQSLSYKTRLTFFLLFPTTHAFSAIISLSVARVSAVTADATITRFIILSSIVCMLVDFMIIFVVDHIEKVETENIEKERMLIKNTFDIQQTMMLKKEKQEFRKIKHDLSNIINTARGFIEIGKPEKALAILKSTNEDLEGIAGFSICANEIINTVLFIKQKYAEDLGVRLIPEIDEENKINLDDYDLCRLLNNIIDNSINAAGRLISNKISRIYIHIDEEFITVKSENEYRKSDEQGKAKKSENHGNGVEIIKEIAKKYDGKYSSNAQGNIYFTYTTLKNKESDGFTPPQQNF